MVASQSLTIIMVIIAYLSLKSLIVRLRSLMVRVNGVVLVF